MEDIDGKADTSTDGAFAERAWSRMCAVYGQPGVSQACIDLQDVFDVDVPLLLLLDHADRLGVGMRAPELTAFLQVSAMWQGDVVAPLRAIRRDMKGRYGSAEELALREAVKALELQAEKIEVRRLAGLLIQLKNAGEAAQMSNAYLARQAVPADERRKVMALLDAAADGLDQTRTNIEGRPT
jgi:uncharacterized protein (TIGR02444 family)